MEVSSSVRRWQVLRASPIQFEHLRKPKSHSLSLKYHAAFPAFHDMTFGDLIPPTRISHQDLADTDSLFTFNVLVLIWMGFNMGLVDPS